MGHFEKCKYAESCGYEFCPCEECIDFEAKVMTNADRIRAMSDEELAKIISCPKRVCDKIVIHVDGITDCDACAAESLGDMMKNTSAIASDVLAVTRRIHGYMFGGENECCEKSDMPRCFREELAKTRYELMATMEALAKLSSMLGL